MLLPSQLQTTKACYSQRSQQSRVSSSSTLQFLIFEINRDLKIHALKKIKYVRFHHPNWISNHTLAENIITSHNTPNPLLNSHEFDLLRRFVLGPSSKPTLLSTESESGTSHEHLATSIITQSGTSNPALTDPELTLLKCFFQSTEVDISSGAGPMLRSHTLAYNVILRPHEILDEREMGILRRFCGDPGESGAILRELGIGEGDGLRAGKKEVGLAGYCVETSGTEREAIGGGR